MPTTRREVIVFVVRARARQPELYTIRPEDKEWLAVDSQKGTIPAHQSILPVYAIRGDTIYEPIAIERP